MNSTVSRYANSKQDEVKALKLTISYKFVEHSNDYFFLHGLSQEYYVHLTKTLERLQEATEEDLRKRKPVVSDLVPKPINFDSGGSITHTSFPISKNSDIYSFIRNRTREQDPRATEETIKNDINSFVKNSFEIRLATSYGRIHGFIEQNTFYIVWFDPAHNLFLSKHLGKPTKLDLPHEVEKIKPICPTVYQECNEKLDEVLQRIELIEEECYKD